MKVHVFCADCTCSEDEARNRGVPADAKKFFCYEDVGLLHSSSENESLGLNLYPTDGVSAFEQF